MTSDVMVLVVSADSLVRSALARLLNEEPGFTVAESVGQGVKGIARSSGEARPDVIVLDAQGGPPAVREAVRTRSDAGAPSGVIALVSADSADLVAETFTAGARGVVAKDAQPSELAIAVREVSAGHVFASRTAMRLLVERISPTPEAVPRLRLLEHEQLSQRERDAVRCLARGMTNQEIARAMFVSEATVKAHLSKAMTKWGVRDRVQLVIRALGSDLVDRDDRQAVV